MAEDTQEIDFSNVDWDKLSNKEFHVLAKKLESRNKSAKVVNAKAVNYKKFVSVVLGDKTFSVPQHRLSEVKTEEDPTKKKELIEKLKKEFPPVEEF